MLQPRDPDVPETAPAAAGSSVPADVDELLSSSTSISTSPREDPRECPGHSRASLVHVGPYPCSGRRRIKGTRKTSGGVATSGRTRTASQSCADELSTDEQDTSEMGTDTERYQWLMFRLAPDLAGCLLQFSIDIQRKVRETGHEGNVLLSPFFVASSLIMLLRGASGNTHAQIAKALHMEWDTSGTADRFEQTASELFREFERAKMRRLGFRITCLMTVFFDESIPVHKEYYRLQDTMCYFMDRRDFLNSSDQNRLTMDALARAISSFSVPREQVFPPGSVGPDTLVVLLTSLRLEGRWKRRFTVSKGIFHRMPGEMTSDTKVPTMRCTAPFRTVECAELEATLVEVPYENPHNCLLILLPTGPGGLASVEEKVSAPLLLRSIDQLRDAGEVELSLPKFTIRQVTDLTQVLPSLGVREAFAGEALLDRMTPATDKGVHVSSIRHVATIHVSQAGGARPAVPMTGQSPPAPVVTKKVAVDRPFMFVVLNKKPDLVLFLGSVTTVT
ncbi:iris-like [Rhipicephalus microplus]|uniref:iris-like n=1 Tax=Rhipicephalus microplus TaxID=6941 RepID=UPI003F6B71FA